MLEKSLRCIWQKKSDKENYDKMPDFDDINNMIEIEDVD